MPFGVAWPTRRARRSTAASSTPLECRAEWSVDKWAAQPAGRGRRTTGRLADGRGARLPGPSDREHRVVARARLPGPRMGQGDAGGRARRSPSMASVRATRSRPPSSTTPHRMPSRAASATRRTGAVRWRPQGVARETQHFRMSAEDWRSRERAAVVIEGLDACRPMFGIDARSRPRRRRRHRPSCRPRTRRPTRRSTTGSSRSSRATTSSRRCPARGSPRRSSHRSRPRSRSRPTMPPDVWYQTGK